MIQSWCIMIFRHLGVSVGNHIGAATDDEQLKSITLRFPELELGMYDAFAKATGLSRQDFMQHLIRSSFNIAAVEFARGYLESNPRISLKELLYSHTDSGEVKGLILNLLSQIDRTFRTESDEQIEQFESGGHEYQSPPTAGLYEVSK
jgi:hypothetical protein